MINKNVEKAMNDHINDEFYSAYLYLSMSAWLQTKNLPGFANWMMVQYQEEVSHGMKFFNYLHERGGEVKLEEIGAPTVSWKSALHVFEETLKHEQYVTSRINDLVDVSIENKDHASHNFLMWFVNEQVEEEATAQEMIGKLTLIGDAKESLYHLDKELGQRVFVDQTQAQN